MSITVWTLLGVLVFGVFGLLVWRVTKGKRKAGEKVKINPLKSTKMTAQIALGMNITFGFKTLANILVKNRYAKAGFSLIPTLVEHNECLFLIGNVVDGTKRTVTIGKSDGRTDAWVTTKKGREPCLDWSFSHYHDWERFIRGLGYPVRVFRIVPYLGSVNFEQPDPSLVFLPVEDIGNSIRALASEDQNILKTEVPASGELLFRSLSDLNLFTKKGQSPRKMAKRLME